MANTPSLSELEALKEAFISHPETRGKTDKVRRLSEVVEDGTSLNPLLSWVGEAIEASLEKGTPSHSFVSWMLDFPYRWRRSIKGIEKDEDLYLGNYENGALKMRIVEVIVGDIIREILTLKIIDTEASIDGPRKIVNTKDLDDALDAVSEERLRVLGVAKVA